MALYHLNCTHTIAFPGFIDTMRTMAKTSDLKLRDEINTAMDVSQSGEPRIGKTNWARR